MPVVRRRCTTGHGPRLFLLYTPAVPQRPVIVAIDGPAGAGKSATARELALRLGVPYLDTGAMYRAVGLLAARAGVAFPLDEEGERRVAGLAAGLNLRFAGDPRSQRVSLGGEDVTDTLRGPVASQRASMVSAVPAVRREMVKRQRELVARSGAVVEGRDIGTVVFPDATAKFFLTASAEVRARRRCEELRKQGISARWEEVVEEQRQRDLRDSTRNDSPLRPADDAIVLDTSELTLAEVVESLLRHVRRALTA